MESIKINNIVLEFNKIWYIDNTVNSDGGGTGTKEDPFRVEYLSIVHSNFSTGDAVVLGAGSYILNTDKRLGAIIGQGKGTMLRPDSSMTNKLFTDRFIRLHLSNSSSSGCLQVDASTMHSIIFDNCSIDSFFSTVNDVATFLYSTSGILNLTFNNCVIGVNYNNTILNIYGWDASQLNVICNNCVIQLSSDFIINTWQYSKKQITKNNCISDRYVATYGASFVIPNTYTWKNAGVETIKDPDGSRSSIGVYGGEFALGLWSNIKKLIKMLVPVYVYEKSHTQCKVNAAFTNNQTGVDENFSIKKNTNTLSPIGINRERVIDVASLEYGDNVLTATASDDSNASFTIVKEALYRSSVNRIFKQISGGFKKENVQLETNANVKTLYSPDVNTENGNKNIQLDKYVTKISL